MMMRAMAAGEPGGPEVLRPLDLPTPEPGPGQARLRVAFVSMNPLDAMLRRERLDWMPVAWPFVPGIEHSGIVDAVGEGVDPALVGRRMLSRAGFGGYADYSVVPAAGLLSLPDAMSLEVGACYRGCSSTAWYALHATARIQSGETVLIHSAAGAIGGMAMQIAAEAGARVVGLAGGPAKVAFARELMGEREATVIDYLASDWPDQARAAVGERGFDIILDGNGGPNATHNLALAAVLGRIVYVGATAGSPAPSPPVPALIARSVAVAGMDLRSVETRLGFPAEPIIRDAIVGGRWRAPISEVVPLADVADLHARLEARQVKGRAVIEVGGEPA